MTSEIPPTKQKSTGFEDERPRGHTAPMVQMDGVHWQCLDCFLEREENKPSFLDKADELWSDLSELWDSLTGFVSYVAVLLYPWILFGYAPVGAAVIFILLSAVSIPIAVVLSIVILYHPKEWEPLENFVFSLSVIALLISDIVGAFSTIYLQLGANTGCFSNMGLDNMNHSLSHVDALYFTLSTLTTVGYGDIHPVSGSCRGWVTGQLSVTLIVIGLVITGLATRIMSSRQA